MGKPTELLNTKTPAGVPVATAIIRNRQVSREVWFKHIKNENAFRTKVSSSPGEERNLENSSKKGAALHQARRPAYLTSTSAVCHIPIPSLPAPPPDSRLRKTEVFIISLNQVSLEAAPQHVLPDAIPGRPVMPQFLAPKLSYNVSVIRTIKTARPVRAEPCNL